MAIDLNQYIPKKARAWAFAGITALTGCGDTNNNHYMNSGSGEEGQEINTCEDVVGKAMSCNLTEPNSSYDSLVSKCKEKNWLNTGWYVCFKDKSCTDLAAGICDQYANNQFLLSFLCRYIYKDKVIDLA